MLPFVWICPECRTIYRDYTSSHCTRDSQPLAEVQAHQIKARYPLLGKVIDDRYHLIGGLGQGGLGTVYLAEHRHLEQLFAVKFLDLETVGLSVNRDQKKEYQTDFMKEAKVASLIRHDSVVRVIDFGEFEHLPYLVMEYVPGPSLLKMITQVGRFTVAEATKIARKIASALDAFHERQLVHRDLKPANVILDPRGGGLLTLVDLGLVKDISGAAGRNSTHPMALRGTPGYLAPEQVPKWVLSGAGIQLPGDKQMVDTRVDMYALGVIFYEMLAGLSPYPDGSNTQIIVYACTRPPLPLSKVDPPIGLSPGLEQLIYDTMARDPARRPQTAREFIDRLDALSQAGEPSASWPVIHTTVGHASMPKPVRSRHLVSPEVEEDARMRTQLFHSMDEDFTENISLEGDNSRFQDVGHDPFDTQYDATMEIGDDSFAGLLDQSGLDASSDQSTFRRNEDLNMTRVDSRAPNPVHSLPTRRKTDDPSDLHSPRRRSPSPRAPGEPDIAVAETLDSPNEARTFYWIGLIMVTITTISLVWFFQNRIDSNHSAGTQSGHARKVITPPLELDPPPVPKTVVQPTRTMEAVAPEARSENIPEPNTEPAKPPQTSPTDAQPRKPLDTQPERRAKRTPQKASKASANRTKRRKVKERSRSRARPRPAAKPTLERLQQKGDAAYQRRDFAGCVRFFEPWLKQAKKSHPMYFTIQDRVTVCRERL